MGVKVWNTCVICDHATPERRTVVEFHMEFPIPYSDLDKVQNWLRNDQWKDAITYLSGKYPERRDLIADWLENSQARSEGKQKSPRIISGI